MLDAMTLCLLQNTCTIYRLKPEHEIPESIWQAEFVSVTRTINELSIVLSDEIKINYEKVSSGWLCFYIKGTLSHDMVGVMARLSGTLAKAGCSLFALSTFDTDYILIQQDQKEIVTHALSNDGFILEHW